MRKTILSLGMGLLCLQAGCISAYSQRQVALRQDQEVCARYGVDYESPVYRDCIAVQEQRREAATARQNRLTAQGIDVIEGRSY